MTVQEFLDKVYEAAANADRGIDIIFKWFDTNFSNGNFKDCDSALVLVDLEKLNIDLILSFLTITLAAKHRLEQRNDFYNRAKDKISKLEPKRVDRLLVGLK